MDFLLSHPDAGSTLYDFILVETGINATIGFEELSRIFDKSSKSLMRMFGPKGNPQANNLFAVIGYLQEQEGIHLEVKARKVAWGCCPEVFNRHILSILKDFLNMVFFMARIACRKAENVDTMRVGLVRSWYQ
jgi:hypothetical protein